MNKNLKSNLLKLIFFIIFFIIILLISNDSYAKSYSIENMDIQATILEDGSINIKQSITYDFNGSYNGIYITIPFTLNDNERNEINNNIVNDTIYNGDSVSVNNITDSNEYVYSNTTYASNGKSGIYTIDKDNEKYTIKIYSPSQNVRKTFIIDYNISNICVSYLDVGELYYNFIGGEWDVDVERLNIDILLPDNISKDDLYAFGHGSYNGVVTIVSENKVNFKIDNVRKGQYVAARVVFNRDNIKSSKKTVSEKALLRIMNEEKRIYENKENKEKFTDRLFIFAMILLIYWLILLFIYERDKKYIATHCEEEELFEKYDPLIAGCIQGSREILARDIIAVILNLIDKKVIEMDITPDIKNKEPYKYILKKSEQNKEMNEIEEYIYEWLFSKQHNINLADRLKEMPKEKNANKKFKTLNKKAKTKLNKIGANISKVPMALRIFNVMLFIISIILVLIHFEYNKMEVYNFNTIISNMTMIVMYCLVLFPLIMGILFIPINLLVVTRHRVHKIIRRFTGQKVVTTTASIVLIFLIIIVITAIITKTARFVIIDEILIGISLLIMLTDNLMLKNNVNMIEDFSKLNMIKNKLEEDKLFEERDIEQTVLWGKYLAYGVAFGVSGKISKKMKEMHIDDDLESLLESNSMLEYMNSGYYDFYIYASLDRRFVRSYNKATGSVIGRMSSASRTVEVGGFSRTEEVFLAEAEEAGGRRSILNRRSNK